MECIPSNPACELNFVNTLMDDYDKNFPFALVGHTDLSSLNALQLINEFSSKYGRRFRGIRQILNHHPTNPSLTWPRVEHGDYMKSKEWISNFSALQMHDLSFDAQVNPHQLMELASVVTQHPNIQVVIDHMGCIRIDADKHETEKNLKFWREGMKALSMRPNVFVKLSQFHFINGKNFLENEQKRKVVEELMVELIDLFGTSRCMLASNFPVDKFQGLSAKDTFQFAKEVIQRKVSSDNEQQQIYMTNAAKFYKLAL